VLSEDLEEEDFELLTAVEQTAAVELMVAEKGH